MNPGNAVTLDPVTEPLLAPPDGLRWRLVWSSESVDYGGSGTAEVETDGGWQLPAECTVVMIPGG